VQPTRSSVGRRLKDDRDAVTRANAAIWSETIASISSLILWANAALLCACQYPFGASTVRCRPRVSFKPVHGVI